MNINTSRPESTGNDQDIDVTGYHQRSKHRLDGYAPGPDTIDWERQPDPVRRYEGAPLTELPLFRNDKTAPFQSLDLNSALRSASSLSSAPLSLDSLALMLEYSLSLSAWKQYGAARWALRCNPSSGNLHPTEAYVLVFGLCGVEDGVYHYRADVHGLEQRCRFETAPALVSPQVYIGLSSVHWREAWKYGERAYRYCQLDTGHAIAALAYGAALNGWVLAQKALSSADLARLLGTDRVDEFVAGEGEWSECLLQLVGPGETGSDAVDQWLQGSWLSRWQGRAAVLDRRHFYHRPVIDAVASAARRAVADTVSAAQFPVLPEPLQGEYGDNLAALILHRRSAQAFDGETEISARQFFVLLDHLLPRPQLPWSCLNGPPALHAVFFVHRVAGVKPGLYALPRTARGEQLMREQMREQFLWQRVDEAPEHLPFYLLLAAKAERTAANLCCQQPIAGNSAFSLGMLAEFDSVVADSPWRYPELFQEAGAIGQVLYLEAEGIGCQGTGIGCFFDDGVHELLGIEGGALQTLYHFTVGGTLRDDRIVSYPPYRDRQA